MVGTAKLPYQTQAASHRNSIVERCWRTMVVAAFFNAKDFRFPCWFHGMVLNPYVISTVEEPPDKLRDSNKIAFDIKAIFT